MNLRAIIQVVAILTIIFSCTTTKAMAGPRATIKEPTYDAGEIPMLETIEHNFIIENKGDAPLEISVQPC